MLATEQAGERGGGALDEPGPARRDVRQDRAPKAGTIGRRQRRVALAQAEGGRDRFANHGVLDLVQPALPVGDGVEVLRERVRLTAHQTFNAPSGGPLRPATERLPGGATPDRDVMAIERVEMDDPVALVHRAGPHDVATLDRRPRRVRVVRRLVP